MVKYETRDERIDRVNAARRELDALEADREYWTQKLRKDIEGGYVTFPAEDRRQLRRLARRWNKTARRLR